MKQLQMILKNADVVVGLCVIGILMLMVVPLRPLALDFFFTISIASSLGILLLAIYTKRPLDFSIFPTVLLVATLFRLGLNVASVRLILTEGHTGTEAAGSLIHAFGEVVVGGNYVVGFIVFVILVVINFIVVTKGAGRVSEVAARFTLDALPGKQMAIDADLNAGIINQAEAQRRRRQVESEADFYGAMDGSSKFVRGDAIAGIFVTLINVIGGLIIGTMQRGLDLATAAKVYTLLSVGDGLVAQIPALIISTAAGIVVTRAASGESLGHEMSQQIFMNEKVFYLLGGAMFVLGVFLPGTFLVFTAMSLLSLGLGYLIKQMNDERAKNAERDENDQALEGQEKSVRPAAVVEALQLEVGYGLISVVDSQQKGDLLDRIQAIRKQFAQDLGIVVPPLNIRDNLQLKPGGYVFYVRGLEVGRGDLMIDHFLAMDPGGVTEKVDGIPTQEPVFGLDALWIHENNNELAQLAGYTVVDIPTVIATHITECIRKHAHELLGRQEVQSLIEIVQKTHPKVVEEIIPKELSLGVVVKVLQNLLRENVPIRDLVSILESLADAAMVSKDPDQLTEHVRVSLGRAITGRLIDESGELPLLTFSRQVEEKLIGSVQAADRNGATHFAADPALVKQMIPATKKVVEKLTSQGITPVLLVTPMIRHHVKRLLDRFLPQIIVLSHNEIDPKLRVRSVGSIEV